MYRVAAITFACVMVAGCAEMNNKKKDDMTLLQGQPVTSSLQGQPLTAVIARLGIPPDESSAAGSTVYLWSSGTAGEPADRKCQVRAIMSGGVVGSFNYEGTSTACARYIALLR
jgi:hypothetical protein